jgi:hypothetical protein
MRTLVKTAALMRPVVMKGLGAKVVASAVVVAVVGVVAVRTVWLEKVRLTVNPSIRATKLAKLRLQLNQLPKLVTKLSKLRPSPSVPAARR